MYTDGACAVSRGDGGWGCVLLYKDVMKTISGSATGTTNNRMELQAVIEGLKRLKESCEVIVYSDSQLTVKTINIWLRNWLKRGELEEHANADLWNEYIKYSAQHNVRAEWVKGHNGDYFNEMCDKLATQAIKGSTVDGESRKVSSRLK